MDERVIELARALISRASITPADAGCQTLVRECLQEVGFKCLTLRDSGTENLLALHGSGKPFLLFLGHTDVVPPGDESAWDTPPFEPELVREQGKTMLCGRGSADMKGSDAAMTVALHDFVKEHPDHPGTLGLLLTSNEEGDAKGGTPFVAEYLKHEGLIPDCCLVGEPSAIEVLGDQIKVGRRGSLSADVTVFGVQGHVAYPERCDNAARRAAALMDELSSQSWDLGTDVFPPTSFQITNIRCGTGAENVAPGECFFMCNWRFNPASSPESLKSRLLGIAKEQNTRVEVVWRLNGLPFVTRQGDFLQAVTHAVESVTGLKPRLSTSGGTSDGRFIAPLGAQTLEVGPSGATIHKVNERVDADDLKKLAQIYLEIIRTLFPPRS